ncbi:MAG: hypothetical protein LJE59_06355 [Chromatiaceae bacterium]|jgi:hypothetical protein|nr:hypothetical protein [Chromatiaceae bacterium]
MLAALEQTERLLRDYGRTYEANLVSIAHAAFQRDPKAACRAINTAEWWDSSRSLAAIDLAVEGGFTPAARRDAQALREALIQIFTTMLAYGEHNDAGEIIVSQFRKWLQSRV